MLISGYMLTNQTHLGELGIDLGRLDDTSVGATFRIRLGQGASQ